MRTGRRHAGDIDHAKLVSDFAKRRNPTEAEIASQAEEDGSAWTEEELARAVLVYPPPNPQQVRELRARLGLTQAEFARRFGFTVNAVQQYEQGRRVPSGPASTLLRIIDADPDAVMRALAAHR